MPVRARDAGQLRGCGDDFSVKLVDLNPRWIGIHNWSSDSIFRIGLSFDSPTSGKRLAILFDPPIDPDGLMSQYGWGLPFPEQKHWQRTGENFETLTLSPSVDFSGAGEWHGHIQNGQVN